MDDLLAKAQRERLRWEILNLVESQRPAPANADVLAVALAGPTKAELHRELRYLADRGLVSLDDQRLDWRVTMTWPGIDVVDYVVECGPGIARPDGDDATMTRATRGSLRWRLLVTLNFGGGAFVGEDVLAATMLDSGLPVTLARLRRNLDYLELRGLVATERGGRWQARINRHGVDLVEYSIDCAPGIARPRAW